MVFSSLNPYQYLDVYFDFFAGPVTQLSNISLIISVYLPIPGCIQDTLSSRASKGILQTTFQAIVINNILEQCNGILIIKSISVSTYLAVYFYFFAGPVMQFSNMCLIISIYLPIYTDY